LSARLVLVVVFRSESYVFGDETLSRHLFELGNPIFWRRDPFSSSFWAGKLPFLATSRVLVAVLGWETRFFGDENLSRHHFEPGNSLFWRRAPFSSSFWAEKPHFLATKPFLVVILSRETPFFGDEPRSRRHFEPGNPIFWRRALFSSPFWGEKVVFLAARLVLVVVFRSESYVFGDETPSRRHFEPGNSLFWRRGISRRHFEPGNPIFWRRDLISSLFLGRKSCFWRRDSFSSSFWAGKLPFLATSPFLVVILSRETPFFGDEPFSHRRFGVENSIFWRRAAFSSPFWGEKVMFLAARLVLVVVFRSESHVFGDETLSRHHFELGNPIFWRRDLITSLFLCEKVVFLTTKPDLVANLKRETPHFVDESFLPKWK